VQLWHWPIRAMHWLAAGSIVVLIATGFYIGRPYFMTAGEASDHFLMGRMRFVHFVAAAVLVGRPSCACTGCSSATATSAGRRCSR
jgi:Ni/Fe-hydrogenase 1 B-type cytochrome subunit